MKLKLFTAIAVLAGLAMASGTPEEGKGKKHPGHPGIKQLIEKFDKDGDGKISTEEKKAIAAEWKKRRGDHGRRPHPGKRPHTPKGDKPDAKKPHSGKRPHHSKRPHTPKGKKPGKSPAKKKQALITFVTVTKIADAQFYPVHAKKNIVKI